MEPYMPCQQWWGCRTKNRQLQEQHSHPAAGRYGYLMPARKTVTEVNGAQKQ